MNRFLSAVRLLLVASVAIVASAGTASAQPSAANTANGPTCYECQFITQPFPHIECVDVGIGPVGYHNCTAHEFGCTVDSACDPDFATNANVDATGTRRTTSKASLSIARSDTDARRACNGAILKRHYSAQKVAAMKKNTVTVVT